MSYLKRIREILSRLGFGRRCLRKQGIQKLTMIKSPNDFPRYIEVADFTLLKAKFTTRIKFRIFRRLIFLGILTLFIATSFLWVSNPREYSASPNDLAFSDSPLVETLASVEKTFGLKIAVADHQISGCRFTGLFIAQTSESKVLESLAERYNIKIHRSGEADYIIKGIARCPYKK